ncbi:MAG: DUF6504 family protein [Mycobacteriales bacterium]
MSRRYSEAIQVVRRDESPDQFLWRERLYQVRDVLARWVETDQWWAGPQVVGLLTEGTSAPSGGDGPGGVGAGEREFWRVEAAAGRSGLRGVFDLCFDWATGSWQLTRVLD